MGHKISIRPASKVLYQNLTHEKLTDRRTVAD